MVASFVKKQSYSFPILLDIYKVVGEKKYNIKSLPRLIIIDQNGVIRLVKKGFHDREKFMKTLQIVIDEMFVEE